METVASHLRTQGFFVVASGVVSYHTKIYASAKGMGVSNLFYAELVGWISVARANVLGIRGKVLRSVFR